MGLIIATTYFNTNFKKEMVPWVPMSKLFDSAIQT